MQVHEERRKKRSQDPITALHYQLAFTRSAGGLEAVVLVDESGCLIAGAGAWPVCEELAAYAPLLARPQAIRSAAVGTRIAAMSNEVTMAEVSLGGAGALLCTRGGRQRDQMAGNASATSEALLAHAADACRRILDPS